MRSQGHRGWLVRSGQSQESAVGLPQGSGLNPSVESPVRRLQPVSLDNQGPFCPPPRPWTWSTSKGNRSGMGLRDFRSPGAACSALAGAGSLAAGTRKHMWRCASWDQVGDGSETDRHGDRERLRNSNSDTKRHAWRNREGRRDREVPTTDSTMDRNMERCHSRDRAQR